jgi:hypothetical protein
MVPLANILPTLMFFAGCVLLTIILLRRPYRYFRRRTHKRVGESAIEQQPRPKQSWSGMQKDTVSHIERQKVELHDMPHDVTGQLNSKILLLQQLMSKSDQQIEQMEKLLNDLQEQRA